MHGDGTIDFVSCEQLVHLGVALFVVSHLDGRHSRILERADVLHVDAGSCCQLGSGHGVLFAVLTAHARERDLGACAELACLQAFGHLHEDLGYSLFE